MFKFYSVRFKAFLIDDLINKLESQKFDYYGQELLFKSLSDDNIFKGSFEGNDTLSANDILDLKELIYESNEDSQDSDYSDVIKSDETLISVNQFVSLITESIKTYEIFNTNIGWRYKILTSFFKDSFLSNLIYTYKSKSEPLSKIKVALGHEIYELISHSLKAKPYLDSIELIQWLENVRP